MFIVCLIIWWFVKFINVFGLFKFILLIDVKFVDILLVVGCVKYDIYNSLVLEWCFKDILVLFICIKEIIFFCICVLLFVEKRINGKWFLV